MLSRLDVLENHPSFYVRDRDMIKVIPDKKNEDLVETEIECWIYFLKQFKPSLLSEPYLTEYHSEGDHAKPYTLPHNRVPGYQPKTDVLIT